MRIKLTCVYDFKEEDIFKGRALMDTCIFEKSPLSDSFKQISFVKSYLDFDAADTVNREMNRVEFYNFIKAISCKELYKNMSMPLKRFIIEYEKVVK